MRRCRAQQPERMLQAVPSPPEDPPLSSSLAKSTTLPPLSVKSLGHFLGAWCVEWLPLGSTPSLVPGSAYNCSVLSTRLGAYGV